MNKKILAIFLALSLSGCHEMLDLGIGVKPVKVPDAPAHLMQKAGPLPPITETTLDAMTIGRAKDSQQYNDVAHRYNNLIDFYACVQKSLNEKTDVKKCLN